MIKFFSRYLYYIDTFFNILTFFAGFILEKYGLNPGLTLNNNFFLIITAYVILLIAIVIKFFLIKHKKNIDELKIELNCYKKIVFESSDLVIEKIRNRIMTTAKRLNFYNQNSKTDRITVYALLNDSFFALSRFSLNPNYQRMFNNKKYSFDKGCIGRGYSDGFFYDSGANFPNPETHFKEYKDYTKRTYNYTLTEVGNMSMHSVCYAVERIYKNDKCLGVIVLESTKPERFSEKESQKELKLLAEKIYYFLDILDIKARQLSNDIKFPSKTAQN